MTEEKEMTLEVEGWRHVHSPIPKESHLPYSQGPVIEISDKEILQRPSALSTPALILVMRSPGTRYDLRNGD